MFERTLTISSSGKSYSLTGWKIGWASGPSALVAAVEGAKNWLSYSSGAPFQPAIAHALDAERDFPRRLRAELAGKRAQLCAGLAELDVDVFAPAGTYFVLTDVRRYGHADGATFCREMAERARVVAIPAQVFYDDLDEGRHLVRWAFCKQPEVIDEGLRRLSGADLSAG
jgi:N-succinyldiaminopimelate aminotransferase